MNKARAELKSNLLSIMNDISYDALPNSGSEKVQWLNTLSELKDVLDDCQEISELCKEVFNGGMEPQLGIRCISDIVGPS